MAVEHLHASRGGGPGKYNPDENSSHSALYTQHIFMYIVCHDSLIVFPNTNKEIDTDFHMAPRHTRGEEKWKLCLLAAAAS